MNATTATTTVTLLDLSQLGHGDRFTYEGKEYRVVPASAWSVAWSSFQGVLYVHTTSGEVAIPHHQGRTVEVPAGSPVHDRSRRDQERYQARGLDYQALA